MSIFFFFITKLYNILYSILTTPSITKIPEELVYNHLKHINEFPQPSQIVLLFYVLMFNEIIQQYPHHSLISGKKYYKFIYFI